MNSPARTSRYGAALFAVLLALACYFALTGLPPRLDYPEALRWGFFVAAALVIVALQASRFEAMAKQGRALAREQAARAAAEQSRRAMEEALGAVAHELRTPASAVLGWVRVLRSGALDGDSARRALEVIERNAQLQAHLAGDLLDAARVTAGKLRLDMRHVELAAVVGAALESVLPAAASEGIEVRCETGGAAGNVWGDPDRLQQVVVNLLSNAVKFTPGGGRIEVRLERAATHAQLTVCDTGVGIAETFLPHVFERFSQGDSPAEKRQGGLGLGLALARDLVEMHGGTIGAESGGEGRGAVFVVRLPLADNGPEGETEGAARPPAVEGDELIRRDNDGRLACRRLSPVTVKIPTPDGY